MLCLGFLCACSKPAMIVKTDSDNSVSKAVQSSGIHLDNVDPGTRPQDDFYSYVNGRWLRDTQIPEDKSEGA
jgi:putative endopeptidase